MEEITLGQIGGAIALLVVIFGGIAKMVAPIKTFSDRLDKVEKHQDNDNKRLDQLESDTKQILLSVNALMAHSVDGNHTEQLKQRKDELNEYLIKR